MTEDGPKVTQENGAVQIPVHWGSSEHLETIYVNHLVITHAGPEFYLVFGELPMPPFISPDEVPSELAIIPRVRLAVSPKAMRSIAQAMQENLEKWSEKEKS